MSTPFSRSLRSLERDTFRPSLLGMSVLVLFLAAWLGWFFLADVALYEVSADARLTSGTEAIVEFPPTALGRVRPGQSAQLRFDSFPWTQYGTVAATVADVTRTDDHVEVVLSLHTDTARAIPLQSGLTGSADVRVERLSPATLVLRIAGARIAPATSATGEHVDTEARR